MNLLLAVITLADEGELFHVETGLAQFFYCRLGALAIGEHGNDGVILGHLFLLWVQISSRPAPAKARGLAPCVRCPRPHFEPRPAASADGPGSRRIRIGEVSATRAKRSITSSRIRVGCWYGAPIRKVQLSGRATTHSRYEKCDGKRVVLWKACKNARLGGSSRFTRGSGPVRQRPSRPPQKRRKMLGLRSSA